MISPNHSPNQSPNQSPKYSPSNNSNGRPLYYTSSYRRLYDQEITSIVLSNYLRERGWSLPDYDNNNNAIVGSGGGVVVRESETLRKESLALLETTLCRWAASIGRKKEDKLIVATTENNNKDSTDNNSTNENICRRLRVTLITIGSYRLGAYRPDADVDLLALCPPSCTRDDFFTSLVTLMEKEPSICDIHPIASAFTPVLKFTINSINFDVLFGRAYGNENIEQLIQHQRMSPCPLVVTTTTTTPAAANVNDKAHDDTNANDAVNADDTINTKTPKRIQESADDCKNVDNEHDNNDNHEHGNKYKFPINDSFLTGMDDSEIRSANGVRVTQYIMEYVPHPDRFRLVLCAVKEWATVHGIYSNVLGFFGGVNWAIMVAYVCKRYPSCHPISLLKIFFQTFATWPWPKPVLLDDLPQQKRVTLSAVTTAIGGMKPWDPQTNPRDARHVMPIITPVFPRMNSAYNVGISQQRRIQEELIRAAFFIQHELNWKLLYNRSDFFYRHANFLQITIRAGNNPDEFTKWLRLCESRLRILVCALDCPEMSVWPFGKVMKRDYTPETCDDSSSVNSSDAVTRNNENGLRLPEALFFIGLRFARNVESINLKQHTSEFLINQINSWEGRKPGMDFIIQHVLQGDLPQDMINEHHSNGQSDDDLQTSLPSILSVANDTIKIGPQATKDVRRSNGNIMGTSMAPCSNKFSSSGSCTNEPPRQQEDRTQTSLDGMEFGSRPDFPIEKFVTLEGLPPQQTNFKKGEIGGSDDISHKINQEQLYSFLTGKTDDLPPCVGSNDECTQSTESENLSTMSPDHKRPRNRPRSGTEGSDLF